MSGDVSLFMFSLRQMARRKATFFLLLLSMIPAAIMAYVVAANKADDLYLFFTDLTSLFYLQIIILIVALVLGTSIIHDEVSKGTISYLATRPLSRKKVVLIRYLAYVPVAFALIAIPTTVSFMSVAFKARGIYANIDLYLGFLFAFLLGVAVYGAIFCLIGIAIRAPLMVGLLFVFVWEGIVTNFPGRFHYATVLFYIRSILSHLLDIGDLANYPTSLSLPESVVVLIAATAVIVYAGARIFSKKDIA